MFGRFKKMVNSAKILALGELAVEALARGDVSGAEKWFDQLTEFPLEDLQKTFMDQVKSLTESGDIEEILDAPAVGFQENSLELITLVWQDDVDAIMSRMDNNPGTFVGTFAPLVGALTDSEASRRIAS